jgi:phage shock protein A
MTDVEARVIRLEQKVAELERQLRVINQRNGQAEQQIGTIRNSASGT